MSEESNQQPQSFPDAHPNLCRLTGALALMLSAGSITVLALSVPPTASILGPALSGLAGAFAGAASGGYFKWTMSRTPLFPGGKVDEDIKIKETVRRGGSVGAALLGTAALSLSLAGQWDAARQQELEALPEIDPHIIVETKEVRLHERACMHRTAGRKVAVTHDGTRYSLLCPTNPPAKP